MDSKSLVVGDIVHLRYGEIVNFDGVVLNSNQLTVTEDGLTSDSAERRKEEANATNVGKHPDPILLKSMCITGGEGKAMVLAVGQNTQLDWMKMRVGVFDKYDFSDDTSTSILGKDNFKISNEPWNTQFRLGIGFFLVILIAAVVRLVIDDDDDSPSIPVKVAEAILVATILFTITLYSYME